MVDIPDIEQWDPAVLQQVLDAAKNSGNSLYKLGEGLDGTKKSLESWDGQTAEAWRAEHGKVRTDINAQHGQTQKAASTISAAIDDVRWCVNELKDARAAPEAMGMKIQPDGTVVDPQERKTKSTQESFDRLRVRTTAQERLKALIVKATATDVEVANALRMAVGDIDKIAPIPAGAPSAPTAKQVEQKKNQTEAFQKVFGRAPTTPADWKSAEALDPHSYDPKNKGTPPNIVAGKIQPVPGQGVVQGNLFIPGKDAVAPTVDPKRPLFLQGLLNSGDNRGFNPNAPSEANRVQLTVDYENGIVVARQNPSVNMTTGAVQPGIPDVSVAQNTNGAVLVHYNTADPFSPGGDGVGKMLNYSVNGDLAIQPGVTGPKVGGNITTFPSLEVVHTAPDGQVTSLLQSAPSFVTNEYGPMVGLLSPTKSVGDIGIISDFNSYFPTPTGLLPGGVPGVMSMTLPLTIVPPTLTPLGGIGSIPNIPAHAPVQMPG
ncbi:Uncharacterised protein [Mycobacteroides abscessus subsp. bolletii]|uniref:WXG100 family type VII secretion target n=1 Tax=Mycobacteroides abscessus TaxID=36809 RepID=UPI000926EB03|nr:hypothetical protein [Mycobacteroides abscessus]SIJ32891.1 Uncharacterised protein [Mycobacteroides abscessus subsp. bolletii]